jgi:hypothetical protein
MQPPKRREQEIIENAIKRFQRERKTEIDPEKKSIPVRDQGALLNVDPRSILTGDVEVFDDRQGR